VRYALRTFVRTPGLTVVTVLTLALGLGATTAIFSVVDAVLLKPLPFAEPERLVQIVENVPAEESFGGMAQRRSAMNVDELDWWRTNSTTLAQIAVIQREGRTLATADGSVQLYGSRRSLRLSARRAAS
jgi:putative ABC transport system permease protein